MPQRTLTSQTCSLHRRNQELCDRQRALPPLPAVFYLNGEFYWLYPPHRCLVTSILASMSRVWKWTFFLKVSFSWNKAWLINWLRWAKRLVNGTRFSLIGAGGPLQTLILYNYHFTTSPPQSTWWYRTESQPLRQVSKFMDSCWLYQGSIILKPVRGIYYFLLSTIKSSSQAGTHGAQECPASVEGVHRAATGQLSWMGTLGRALWSIRCPLWASTGTKHIQTYIQAKHP